MTNMNKSTFGEIVRKVRRDLNWTQDDLAQKVQVSTPYIGHLESGKRHPSAKIIERLADTLGLDRRELFFEANPRTQSYLDPPPANANESAWEQLNKDVNLRRQNDISADEMEMLSGIQMAGQVKSVRDFIHILNTVRQARQK
jgi:transcriptional regulator with XRE-family HTH domain